MKKFTKIWLLSLALVGCLVALNASAASETAATKQVQLVITDWENTCTASNYDLSGYTVSSSDQTIKTDTHAVTCEFLDSAATNISFQLTDLKNASNNPIGYANFTWDVSNVDTNWTLNSWHTASITFATPSSVYDKVVNTAWVWTWDLTIGGTIPGWTPAGTYTWNLYVILGATNS